MKKLKAKMKKLLTKKRYDHTLAVVDTAIILAKRFGADVERVKVAALLHDCSKQFDIKHMVELCDCDETVRTYGKLGELLHGFAGSVYAKNELGIEDQEVLDAIKYHTIGRRGMGLIEKIVYLADAIEPNRDYGEVMHIRELAEKNLDDAILHEIDRKIEYLIKREAIIHPNTMDMRNHIIEDRKSAKKSKS